VNRNENKECQLFLSQLLKQLPSSARLEFEMNAHRKSQKQVANPRLTHFCCCFVGGSFVAFVSVIVFQPFLASSSTFAAPLSVRIHTHTIDLDHVQFLKLIVDSLIWQAPFIPE
jgi:hypothetical protein